jgi:hypothetical protein
VGGAKQSRGGKAKLDGAPAIPQAFPRLPGKNPPGDVSHQGLGCHSTWSPKGSETRNMANRQAPVVIPVTESTRIPT